jgi:two-component system chemotaxis sensor kinase CheA
MDAWTTLNLQPFDLVVSDVEMPRMNGFELTARIRTVSSMKDLPVILVTALDTPEDRERGVDAGADAYITKGGFDQERLLDAVRRFV